MKTNQDMSPETFTLRVEGDLISTTLASVRSQAASLLNAPEGVPLPFHTVILDMAAATCIDSAGLNLVVTIAKIMKQSGGVTHLIYSSSNIERVFNFTRLHLFVELEKVPVSA
jgi:anti-anti-sigma factor